MKYIARSAEPESLKLYCEGSTGTWDSFVNSEAYKDVVEKLLLDQRGICAYCEVDLIVSDGVGYSDLRVEHFHPKSDDHPNWTFRWDNLLLTCCGGNRNHISNDIDNRFTSPDHSCDVPKENKILDDLIFHPSNDDQLKDPLFSYSMDGRMAVSQSCPEAIKGRASRTIKELNLSPDKAAKRSKDPIPRLVRMRSSFLSGVQEQVQKLLEAGMSMEEALTILSDSLFPDDEQQNWTKFFSCARWYLGGAAEERLRNLHYIL